MFFMKQKSKNLSVIAALALVLSFILQTSTPASAASKKIVQRSDTYRDVTVESLVYSYETKEYIPAPILNEEERRIYTSDLAAGEYRLDIRLKSAQTIRNIRATAEIRTNCETIWLSWKWTYDMGYCRTTKRPTCKDVVRKNSDIFGIEEFSTACFSSPNICVRLDSEKKGKLYDLSKLTNNKKLCKKLNAKDAITISIFFRVDPPDPESNQLIE